MFVNFNKKCCDAINWVFLHLRVFVLHRVFTWDTQIFGNAFWYRCIGGETLSRLISILFPDMERFVL